MPSTKTKPTNAEALSQVEGSVTRVLTLVRAVLAKYPQETISPALLPFRHPHGAHMIRRRSGEGDEVVLRISMFLSDSTAVRFPVTLLDAHEQQITRWTRDRYWSAVDEAKLRARREARANAEKARRDVEEAQRKLDSALNELAAVSAPGKTKRRP